MLAGDVVAQRETMSLHYIGLNSAQISTELGVSPETVRSNVRHARQSLRLVLQRYRDAGEEAASSG